jgi:hypothetical protein
MAGDRDLQDRPIDQRNTDADRRNRGVNVKVIVAFAVGTILFAVGSILALNGMLHYFEMRENANQARPTGPDIDRGELPPEPRLQEHAVRDLQQMRATEDQILNSYQWVDQQRGAVRIPIDRAMELIARGINSHRKGHAGSNNVGNLRIPAASRLASIDSPTAPAVSGSAANGQYDKKRSDE